MEYTAVLPVREEHTLSLTWMLPNTGIRGYVSSKYFQRPAGDREHGNALVPDVLITPSWDDFMSGKDPAWEWIENNKDK